MPTDPGTVKLIEIIAYISMGAVFGAFMMWNRYKHQVRTPDDLRILHWAMDEQNRWEIRTGRLLTLKDVSALRNPPPLPTTGSGVKPPPPPLVPILKGGTPAPLWWQEGPPANYIPETAPSRGQPPKPRK